MVGPSLKWRAAGRRGANDDPFPHGWGAGWKGANNDNNSPILEAVR
ncbi:hypothetical protein X925_01485 [Petrotoga sp. 9T1HF07.CasAA.8.2]|nr:hypothetical protein X925_01485 [Petrotoga sp. 9T1HF07.CasAA.8.2]